MKYENKSLNEYFWRMSDEKYFLRMLDWGARILEGGKWMGGECT